MGIKPIGNMASKSICDEAVRGALKARGRRSKIPCLLCIQKEAKTCKKCNKLDGKRRITRDFPEKKQSTSLSDLPTEIRLQIFGHLFNAPHNFVELGMPQAEDRAGATWRNIRIQKCATLKEVPQMMRLCKKIRGEVADVLFGGNNFRFNYLHGFQVMAAFLHTIRQKDHLFLKHITVQIPVREYCPDRTIRPRMNWLKFDSFLRDRGLRSPDYHSEAKDGTRGWELSDFSCYNGAVHAGFRQLRKMPNLKLLEITIPWDYKIVDTSYRGQSIWRSSEETTHCPCPFEKVKAMSPAERIRHTVEAHSADPTYWWLLADLKENSASQDLTIALVFLYDACCAPPELLSWWRAGLNRLRLGRWLAAYASLKGYRFGHASWETDWWRPGPYEVRYDEDPMLSVNPISTEEDSLLEPPELPA
ncbi:hypothetical protein diail_543 [Diaporthe ilicicola]|nr:hypothetical protein diail_543 [Diaporthe ilicicola]